MTKWLPQITDIVHEKNPSWLNSAWLGISSQIIHLPFMVINILLKPLLLMMIAFFGGIALLTMSMFITAYAGLTGQLSTAEAELEE